MTCQVDFAENYACSVKEEIQSAYYSKDQVTVHQVVIHFPEKEADPLTVKYLVYVSDVIDHDAAMVLAILKQINSDILKLVPKANFIHYLNDSPSSQYRNRHIFRVIADHAKLFEVPCTWTWFESGHGKGPCDGIGGVAKRNADMAVKQYNCVIDNAASFAKYGNDVGGKLTYKVIMSDEYEAAKNEITEMSARVIAGCLSFHGAITVGDGSVLFRETSCFCCNCFIALEQLSVSTSAVEECGWRRVPVVPTTKKNASVKKMQSDRNQEKNCTKQVHNKQQLENSVSEADNVGEIQRQDVSVHQSQDTPGFIIGDYVLIKLDEGRQTKHFIGKVISVDEDGECEVTWLKRSRKTSAFVNDVCPCSSVPLSDIVVKLPTPVAIGAAKRPSFQFDFDFSDLILG